jgi:hypothetical protein
MYSPGQPPIRGQIWISKPTPNNKPFRILSKQPNTTQHNPAHTHTHTHTHNTTHTPTPSTATKHMRICTSKPLNQMQICITRPSSKSAPRDRQANLHHDTFKQICNTFVSCQLLWFLRSVRSAMNAASSGSINWQLNLKSI